MLDDERLEKYKKEFTFHSTENGWKISCVKGRFAKEDSLSRDWM